MHPGHISSLPLRQGICSMTGILIQDWLNGVFMPDRLLPKVSIWCTVCHSPDRQTDCHESSTC